MKRTVLEQYKQRIIEHMIKYNSPVGKLKLRDYPELDKMLYIDVALAELQFEGKIRKVNGRGYKNYMVAVC